MIAVIDPKNIDLAELPSVSLEDKNLFPEKPAIYFCVDENDTIVYIGRSINPRSRWSNHHRYYDLIDIGKIRVCFLLLGNLDSLPEIEDDMIAC